MLIANTSDILHRPLRIVHIVSSLLVGGMEQFVLRLASAQQIRGHDVTLLALQGGALAERANRLGLRTLVLEGSHKLGRIVRTVYHFKKFDPNIIHAHNPTSLHYAVLGKWVCCARVLMTNHGQGQGMARIPSTREWNHIDAVVAVSNAVATQRDIPVKSVVIPNGIECVEPGRSRKEVRAELALDQEIVGAIVARIDGLKGHDAILRAIARLRDCGVAVVLLVIGDGTERGYIEDRARVLKLGHEHIRFLGFRTDVPDILAACDFFVLPSLTEGLPLSVLEAMSHRLPVVATAVGGIPELITDNQQGLLVPVNDPLMLADAIGKLVCDPGLRAALGEAGYRRVINEFSFDQMVRQYEILYSNLMARC